MLGKISSQFFNQSITSTKFRRGSQGGGVVLRAGGPSSVPLVILETQEHEG